MAKKTKAIVKKEDNMVMEALNEIGFDGFENTDSSSFSIPFLKIAQNQTPQADKSDESYIKGLEPGMFFNSATGTIYGDTIKIVFLYYYEVYTEWGTNRGEYYGIHLKKDVESSNDLDKEGNNYTDGEGHIFIDTRNFFVYLPDYPSEGIHIFSLSSSGITHAKRILTKANSVMYNGQRAKLFSVVWELGTLRNQNDKGKWFHIGDRKQTKISKLGFIEKKDIENIKNNLFAVKEFAKNIQNINFEHSKDPDTQKNEDVDF